MSELIIVLIGLFLFVHGIVNLVSIPWAKGYVLKEKVYGMGVCLLVSIVGAYILIVTLLELWKEN